MIEEKEGFEPLHGTRIECICHKMILEDDVVYGLGIVCLKCGHNAAHRVDEYMVQIGAALPPILTPLQRAKIKYLIEEKQLEIASV